MPSAAFDVSYKIHHALASLYYLLYKILHYFAQTLNIAIYVVTLFEKVAEKDIYA